MKYKYQTIVGHPAAKRDAFKALVSLLRKLGVTDFICVPVTSNPYHLVRLRDIPRGP